MTTTTCRCGKFRYFTRKAAKQAMRRLYPDRANHGRLNAYKCPDEHSTWHLGHLPPVVKRGEATRDDITRRKKR